MEPTTGQQVAEAFWFVVWTLGTIAFLWWLFLTPDGVEPPAARLYRLLRPLWHRERVSDQTHLAYRETYRADDVVRAWSPPRPSRRPDPREEARERTERALAALPHTCPRIPFPHPCALPVVYTPDHEWLSLDLSTPEFWGVFGMKRSGKGNFLQLVALMALEFGPRVAQVWVLDPKSGLDYDFCTRLVHARLYADIPSADGSLTDGYAAAVAEMDRRYAAFAQVGARNILDYHEQNIVMPFLVLIADEVGDLTKPQRAHLEKLARMAGAAGIVLFVATQYPTTEVLSSQVQANLDNRLVLRLASAKQSAVALALGPGEVSTYDPSLIAERGVAVVRHSGGDEHIGRIPEVTDTVRRQIVSRLITTYARPNDADSEGDSDGYDGGDSSGHVSPVSSRHRTERTADRVTHARPFYGQSDNGRVKNRVKTAADGVKIDGKPAAGCTPGKTSFSSSGRDCTDFFTADVLHHVPFSAEELARIVAMIGTHGKHKTPVITSMPGYHPSRHQRFAGYYTTIYTYLDERQALQMVGDDAAS